MIYMQIGSIFNSKPLKLHFSYIMIKKENKKRTAKEKTLNFFTPELPDVTLVEF